MSATLLYLLNRNNSPAIEAAESRGRADGFLDADGFFTQSDEAFMSEAHGTVETLKSQELMAA